MTPYRANPAERALSPDEALARTVLAPLMRPEEELIWAQRPRRGFVFHRRDVYLTFVALVWTGISLFWTFNALHEAPAIGLVGVPFVLVGLHLLVFRHVLHARHRATMFYGLTDRRVLVVRASRRRNAREFPLAHLEREIMALDLLGGGYTDIWLDTRFTEDSQGTRHERMATMPAVPNGEKVFDQIIAQRAAALARLGRAP